MAKRKLIRTSLLCAAIAVLAVLGGCGGGGDDSSSTVASGGEGTGATTTGEAGGSSGKSGDQTGGSSGNGATSPGKGGGSSGGSGSQSSGSSGNGTTPPGKSSGSSGKSGKSGGSSRKSGKGRRSSGKGGGSAGNSGGSAGAPPTSPGGLSKAEFVKRANAICEAGRNEILNQMAAYEKQHGGSSGSPSPAALVQALNAVYLPGLQAQVDEIRALGAPAGDEAKVGAFLAALEKTAQGTFNSAEAVSKSLKPSIELAHEYGIDSCAYG